MVGPVYESTLIVPFIHSTKVNSVALADRYAPGEVDIVSDQYRLAITSVHDKTLVL